MTKRVNYKVELRGDESFVSLMKRFKIKSYKNNVVAELYERRYYKKPSEIKKNRKNLVKFAKKINNFKILYN